MSDTVRDRCESCAYEFPEALVPASALAATREALELKDAAYAHLKSGQSAKAERLAAESWRRRHGERLGSSAALYTEGAGR